MKRKKFLLSHSIYGTAALLLVEGVLLTVIAAPALRVLIILLIATIGAIWHVIVATEAIEEVRSARHLLMLLSAVVAIFVAYFAFQYWFLLVVLPGSFAGLGTDAVSLLLHSVMVFVFNPVYLPLSTSARALLLINTFASLTLVVFVLQNVWQIRSGKDS